MAKLQSIKREKLLTFGMSLVYSSQVHWNYNLVAPMLRRIILDQFNVKRSTYGILDTV